MTSLNGQGPVFVRPLSTSSPGYFLTMEPPPPDKVLSLTGFSFLATDRRSVDMQVRARGAACRLHWRDVHVGGTTHEVVAEMQTEQGIAVGRGAFAARRATLQDDSRGAELLKAGRVSRSRDDKYLPMGQVVAAQEGEVVQQAGPVAEVK